MINKFTARVVLETKLFTIFPAAINATVGMNKEFFLLSRSN